MRSSAAPVWQADLPGDVDLQLAQLFAETKTFTTPVPVFFRADDIGRADSNFVRMISLFSEYDMPLCPALVPEWLDAENWSQIRNLIRKEELFCWHQHGFKHCNYEPEGKKNEFGQSRSKEEIRHDIVNGRNRLEELIADSFLPVFTPPWNRCSISAMQVLQEEGFLALSRSINVQPPVPVGLPDIMINVDLHTRRELSPKEGMSNLLEECRSALKMGHVGFMLHHQCMNPTAFLFLERLFLAINNTSGLFPCTFKELLKAT